MIPAASCQDANLAFLDNLVMKVHERLNAVADKQAVFDGPPWPQPIPKQRLPALLQLSDAFSLAEFETAVLALCAAHEFDSRPGPLRARALVAPLGPWPSFGLAMRGLPPGIWHAISF